MLHLDHPNVLKLLGVCFDTEDQLPAIVLPFMANGDLKSFLVEKRGHNEPSLLPEVSCYQIIPRVHNITNTSKNNSDSDNIHTYT